MEARVLFPGRERNCFRTLKFPETDLDDFSFISLIKEDLEKRSGTIWKKLRLPEHITSQPDPLYAGIVVFIEDRFARVLSDGTVYFPHAANSSKYFSGVDPEY